ncbi:hypothetical protein ATANTOWER_024031 [Ataeniobius toweri]|uniref:Uncharacterized protein n=1 Tax=Ataeniobius toweri TaxID=208326 RepID=A0ABU7BUM2_9TELE|nr:hypothetical protein [Ataeniobius toweri]
MQPGSTISEGTCFYRGLFLSSIPSHPYWVPGGRMPVSSDHWERSGVLSILTELDLKDGCRMDINYILHRCKAGRDKLNSVICSERWFYQVFRTRTGCLTSHFIAAH